MAAASRQDDCKTKAEASARQAGAQKKNSTLSQVKINFDDSNPSDEEFNALHITSEKQHFLTELWKGSASESLTYVDCLKSYVPTGLSLVRAGKKAPPWFYLSRLKFSFSELQL